MQKIALIAAFLIVGFSAFADPANDVRCHEIAFSEAAENRDADAFREFLDDDARFIGSAVKRGPDEILAAWQAFFSADGPAIKWRPKYVEVHADGELALTRGPYRTIVTDPDGKLVESWGTFNSIWRRDAEGEWRVVFDAGNSATSPPDEETKALLELEHSCG